MPCRELRFPQQVEQWLVELGEILKEPGEMILIGSGGLLWHAAQRGISDPLPEDWQHWAQSKHYGRLKVTVPSPVDLLAPKRRRNEPRDRAHDDWAEKTGLL